jgi:hypothetical protein
MTQKKKNWDLLTKGEKFSILWKFFRKGLGAIEIAKKINEDYLLRRPLRRNSVYKIMHEQAAADRLRYIPETSKFLTRKMNKHFSWLQTQIAHTTRFEDIAYLGAETLVTTLKKTTWLRQEEVHIGFAGGHAMRILVHKLARLLSETDDALPKTLVLHALVAGFDVTDPTTDPNTFFTLFHDDTKFSTTFKFIGLQTPPRVEAGEYHKLRKADWFLDSYKHAQKLDFILTSAANWSDEHSTFRHSMKRSQPTFDVLDQADCQGDMLWLPLGPSGPLNVNTDIRSMTLLELDDLADFVSRGKQVYLMLGPCAGCDHPKSEVLSAILASKSWLISHLISDTRTVRGVVDKLKP